MRHLWTAAALFALTPAPGAAQDQPHPLQVKVGRSVSVCATGTIQCPAGSAICDDPGVATPVIEADGLAFQGVSPGTTICSAGSAGGHGPRRVYKVTVSAAAAKPPAAP